MKLIKVTMLLAAVALFALPAFAVTLNEIRVDQPSSDYEEYVELAGMPGESLDDVTLIVIGDGTGGHGVIEAVVSFDGLAIGADGFFLATEASFGTSTEYETCEDAIDMVTTLDFENGDDVTYLLVSGFTGAKYDDLDTDVDEFGEPAEDGILDITPWDFIIDGVAIDSPYESAQLLYYDTVVGPDGTYPPGAVAVCDGTWFVSLYDICLSDTPGFSNVDGCTVPTQKTNFESMKAMFR